MARPPFDEMVRVVDEHEERLGSLLQALIRCPSVVGDEAAVVEIISDYLTELGADYQLHESQPGRPNVVAVNKGTGAGGRNLLVCVHTDHMPVGDESKWDFPPYSGDIVDGWIRGRGAANGKSQVAASLIALKVLVETGYENVGDIVLSLVVDEEAMGTHGAKFLMEKGLIYGDWALLGVPGRTDMALIGCKGPLWLTIRVHGESGHGAAPWLGVNAIGQASKLVQAIQAMKFEKTHPAWEGPRIGTRGGATGTIGVNMIHGGLRPNMIPEHCDVVVDRRLIPNETPEEGLEQIREVLDRLGREEGFNAEIVEVAHADPGYAISPNEPIVGLVEGVAREAIGVPELNKVCASGTGDSRWFVQAGIPTVGYGGGMFGPDGKVAFYRPNEQVRLSEVVEMTKVYLGTMMRGTDPAGS